MKIIKIIESMTGVKVDNISRDDDLLGNGILDSFGFVEVIMELQSEYNVEIPSDIMERSDFRTMNGLEKLIDGS